MVNNFPPELRFDFPLAPHGIALGNGTLQLEIWGDENLCLIIARCDENDSVEPGEQCFPSGSSILELRFHNEARPLAGTLHSDGILRVTLSDGRAVAIECAMDEELAWIEGAGGATWLLRSGWQANRDAGDAGDIGAPLEIQMDDGRGFVHEFGDESLVTVVRSRDGALLVATARGETEDAAREAVARARCKPDLNPIYYWKQFWRAAPRVAWPDAELQRKWDVSLFKQAQASATTEGKIDFLVAFTPLLVQEQSDGIYVLPAMPQSWRELSFDGVRCGDFIVGANVEGGNVVEVRIKSEQGGVLRLHPSAQTRVERAIAEGENWIWRSGDGL